MHDTCAVEPGAIGFGSRTNSRDACDDYFEDLLSIAGFSRLVATVVAVRTVFYLDNIVLESGARWPLEPRCARALESLSPKRRLG